MHTAANRRFRPLPLAAAIALALVPATSHAVTYFVTSNFDNSGNNPAAGAGTGTLRQAIIDANANCLVQPTPTIAFAIGASPTFIGIGAPAPTTTNPLPALTCSGPYSVLIDGTTQPGSVPNSDPAGFNGTFGILLDGTPLVSGFACGIDFNSPGGALTLRGIHFIGFAAGGTSNALCVNSGNVVIEGNRFDQNSKGVQVLGAGSNVAIGSAAASARNYFTGNTVAGVTATGVPALQVANNFIGTDMAGNAVTGGGIGVFASASTISVQNNIIGGHPFSGIELSTSTGNIVGNKIGVGIGGGAIPNDRGIKFNSTGPVVITNNTISNNTSFGVHVTSGTGVFITNNSIFNNGPKNISLDFYGGPVPNDFQDPDGGPNNLQNFPVVSSVAPGPSSTINYTFNSTPGQAFNLDLYSNSALGVPAGQTYLGTVAVNTDASGNVIGPATYTFGGVANFISMTARSAAGDTSEFSPIVAAVSAPAVTVSPPNLSFGNVAINTTSPSMTANLLSSGTSAYQISQLSTGSCYGGPICYGGAEFTCMTDCIPFNPYNPGQSCNITASFSPTFLGPQTVNLAVCDNATGSPRTIVLSATGVPPPTLTLSPSFFDFGNVPVRGRSAPVAFRVQNPAPTPVRFTTSTNGPFAIVGSTCTDPIPGDGACDLDVAFFPTAAGSVTGNVVVAPSSGTPATSTLTGNGTISPVLALPSDVDILYTLGSPPATQRVTLANTGLATLTFTSISISGLPFTLVNNCPSSLPPGSSCDLIIGFSETNRGTFNGTLTIISNAPGGSRAINLRGIASPREVPVLEVTPREIGYGRLALGSVTGGEVVKIRNIGGLPAVFDSLVVTPDFVILSHTCRAPLAPLDSCQALVAMRPLSYGVRFGTLSIRSNAENSPNVVDIFGTSCHGASLTIPRLGIAGGC